MIGAKALHSGCFIYFAFDSFDGGIFAADDTSDTAVIIANAGTVIDAFVFVEAIDRGFACGLFGVAFCAVGAVFMYCPCAILASFRDTFFFAIFIDAIDASCFIVCACFISASGLV